MNIWTYKDGVFTNQDGDIIKEEDIPDFLGQRNWPGPYSIKESAKVKNIDLIIKRLWNES